MGQEKIIKKNLSGGSATAVGINFQAAVTAIAEIHLASGTPLSWLDGIANDVPIAVLAESGGAGDDIRVQLRGDRYVEIQIKHNLIAGKRLWKPLLDLAEALQNDEKLFGLLIVSPNSSGTVKDDLAQDIRRMGGGRYDGIKALAQRFKSELERSEFSVQTVCSRLRIVTVYASGSDIGCISRAQFLLKSVCADSDQVVAAWDHLLRDSALLIENRGRQDASQVLQLLKSRQIRISDDSKTSAIAMLSCLTRWACEANESFGISTINKLLPMEKAWIRVPTVIQKEPPEEENLESALKNYHAAAVRDPGRDSIEVDPETIGRFKRHCVVVAGPGLGKSTLLKRFALSYSQDNYPVLKVHLPRLAARLESNGCSVEEGLFALGLSESGISSKAAHKAGFPEWVILCDGLDECSSHQSTVCQGLVDLVRSHPTYRVIVTTRPIGYHSALLHTWPHYELLPLQPRSAESNIRTILDGLLDPESEESEATMEFATSQLKNETVRNVVSRSALLLGFAVSLAVRRIDFGLTKTQLYERLFRLIQETPNDRKSEAGLSSRTLLRFLKVLGWIQLHYHAADIEDVIRHCSQVLMKDLDMTRLNAETVCERCLQYWEAVGVLERLEHAGERTITFVHKTFGEYTAALYLSELSETDRPKALVDIVGNDNFSEVLAFSATLGMTDSILTVMLTSDSNTAPNHTVVVRALELMTIHENLPDPDLRNEVFDRAFRLLVSAKKCNAIAIGDALIDLCPKYAAELCPRAATLLDHEQAWTRLAAWALVMLGGHQYYHREQLAQTFMALPKMVVSGFSESLGGGLSLGGGNAKHVETFAIAAIPKLVDTSAPSEVDRIIRNVLEYPGIPLRYSYKLADVLKTIDKHELANLIERSNTSLYETWEQLFGNDEYRARQRAANKLILEAFFSDRIESAPDSNAMSNQQSLPFLNISAVLSASQYRERYYDHDWLIEEDIDVHVIREVLKGSAAAAHVDWMKLGNEAEGLLCELEKCKAEDFPFYVENHTYRIDIDGDWRRAAQIGLDCEKLEKALHLKSDWFLCMAANLIHVSASRSQQTEIVQRVLQTGSGMALRAAAWLITELDKALAFEMIMARLQHPLIPGCQHLYEALAGLEVKSNIQLTEVLRKGFFTQGPRTATQAAQLAKKIATPDNTPIAQLLQEAFHFWQEKEREEEAAAERERLEAQKQDGKLRGRRVPESPRDAILEALISIVPPTDDELVAYVTDKQSDVNKVAMPVWESRLPDTRFRDRLISDIANEKMPATFLTSALRNQAPFDKEQLAVIRALLSHQRPEVRYAAMEVLNKGSSTIEEIDSWTLTLLNDPKGQIRDRAQAIRAGIFVTKSTS
jgi:hypothetical protein